MNHTLTALFDDRADAQQAKDRLVAADLAEDQVQIVDQSTPGYNAEKYSNSEDPGIWATIKDIFLPDEDRHHYEEGVRRGSFLLTTQVDEPLVENAVAILDEANSIDIDERTEQWRAEGWDYEATNRAPTLGGVKKEEPAAIPLPEEKLKVGKRDVEQGGVKVRSYVVDVPIQEQVSLRKEQVTVERKRSCY